jgi:hypothetical protein
MSRELLELILPRLAKRLNRQLRRYQAGQLNENQFSQRFELLLQQQHTWLSNRGYPELDSAVAVHGAVLVLSGPGLRAEAEEESIPLEVVEYRAVRGAPPDIPTNIGGSARQAAPPISDQVARDAE